MADIRTDLEYQAYILDDVSRTFALTIPQLPDTLQEVVGNAYLLCRIADTIEDDAQMAHEVKKEFADKFVRIVAGTEPAEIFAETLLPLLSTLTPIAERELIKNTPAVIRITHHFNTRQRDALERCVSIMAKGMAHYQLTGSLAGLKDLKAMNDYCYVVAGVVGEMLTELFCDYSSEIDHHREQLWALAVSFGQGLQMTNILKDIWDDHKRQACWLPQDIFNQYGIEISQKQVGQMGPGFVNGMTDLIAVAKNHLDDALEYTLLIPRQEKGLRKFCIWAIGMAALTLQNIYKKSDFTNGNEVKISRSSVRATIMITNLFIKQDKILRVLFALSTKGLPTH